MEGQKKRTFTWFFLIEHFNLFFFFSTSTQLDYLLSIGHHRRHMECDKRCFVQNNINFKIIKRIPTYNTNIMYYTYNIYLHNIINATHTRGTGHRQRIAPYSIAVGMYG